MQDIFLKLKANIKSLVYEKACIQFKKKKKIIAYFDGI